MAETLLQISGLAQGVAIIVLIRMHFKSEVRIRSLERLTQSDEASRG